MVASRTLYDVRRVRWKARSVKTEKDRILVGPDQRYIRKRADTGKTEIGELHPVQAGRPLVEGQELIRMSAPNDEGWREVDVLYRHSSGPAQVATPAYREGHDRIFGKKREVGLS